MRDRRRVVITGMGVVSPLGNSVEELWDGLVAGRSGIGPITLCDSIDYPCKIAGEVRNLDFGRFMNTKEARRLARFSHLAIAAAHMAVEDADLDLGQEDLEMFGVLLGNGSGGLPETQEVCHDMFSKGGMCAFSLI